MEFEGFDFEPRGELRLPDILEGVCSAVWEVDFSAFVGGDDFGFGAVELRGDHELADLEVRHEVCECDCAIP